MKQTELFYRMDPETIPWKKTDPGYNDFWENEKSKVERGITIDGYHMSGWLYWHINHWHITADVMSDWGEIIPTDMVPTLRDNEIILNEELKVAEKDRKGIVIMGLRQFSKTTMESSYGGRSSILFKGSQNLLMGTSKDDLNNLTSALDYGLLNCTPYFRVPRISRDWGAERVLLGLKNKAGDNKVHSTFVIRNTAGGTKTEKGAGVSNLKSNIWDEIGKDEFLQALVGTKPAMLSEFGWRCIPICVGTGGNVEKAKDAKALFFAPKSHSFIEHEQPDGRKTGLFLPGWLRQDCKYKSTLAEYLLDEGILIEVSEDSELWDIEISRSDKDKAIAKINLELENFKKEGDIVSYNRWKAYYPLEVDDVFLSESHNNFPVDACKAQKKKLELDNAAIYVDLFRDENNVVQFKYSQNKPINTWNVSAKDLQALGQTPLSIFEYPDPEAPFGTYTMGCLPPGEKVMTNQGLKDIEKVTLEDKLINENGEIVEIINLQEYDAKEEDLFELKLSNTFRTTKFTGEHPILSSKYKVSFISNYKELGIKQRLKEFSFDYNKVSTISNGDWIKVPNIYKKIIRFDYNKLWRDEEGRVDFITTSPLDSKDFWWFLGLYLGDGYCVGSRISIAFNSKETYYIEKFKKICHSLFNRSAGEIIREGATTIHINNKQLSRFLLNNFGKYSYGKKIPEWVKYLNHDLKKELIRGYLNSDGCVNLMKQRNYITTEFVSVNLELLESFQDILFSLGYTSSLNLLRKESNYSFPLQKESKTRECYHLRMSNSDSINFLYSILDTDDHKINKVCKFDISKKYEKKETGCFMSQDLEFIYFKIKDIIKTKYTGKVYNFECNTHTFMCHHITTHNCDPYNESESSDKINSLGAIHVYKRHYKMGDPFANSDVATWSGRCKTVGEFHELCRMVMEFYNNANGSMLEGVLPENEDKTMIQYILLKKKGHYFAKSLDLSKEINPTTKANRTIGLAATTVNQKYYMALLVEESKEEYETIDEDGNIVEFYGVSRIKDPMVLEEYINYRGKDSSSRGVHDGNYDRIIARGHALTLAKYYDVTRPLDSYKPKPKVDPNYKPEPVIHSFFGNINVKPKSPFAQDTKRKKPPGINFL